MTEWWSKVRLCVRLLSAIYEDMLTIIRRLLWDEFRNSPKLEHINQSMNWLDDRRYVG